MGPMGSGMGAFLVLIASCLAFAPPCTLGSSRKFDLSVPQSKLVISKGNPFSTNFDPSKSKRLSWHPRVFLYEGFLSDSECDHLISMVGDKKKSSLHIGDGARNSSQKKMDSSIQTYLADSKDAVVSKIEDRISLWSFLPKEYGENMQILKYVVNKSDYNKHGPQSSSGHNWLVTILLYLSGVKLGGQAVFPRSEVAVSSQGRFEEPLKGTQGEEGMPSECAGYAVKPVKGNAILLFHLKPDGVKDKDSQYEVCSILEGEEWLAIKHIHVRKIDTSKPALVSEDGCTDEDDRCVGWAAVGECDRNPVFMIGSQDYYGTCRMSCHVC